MDCTPPSSSVPENSPGKNIGVGCHVLLQGISLPGIEPSSLKHLLLAGGYRHLRSPFLHTVLITNSNITILFMYLCTVGVAQKCMHTHTNTWISSMRAKILFTLAAIASQWLKKQLEHGKYSINICTAHKIWFHWTCHVPGTRNSTGTLSISLGHNTWYREGPHMFVNK